MTPSPLRWRLLSSATHPRADPPIRTVPNAGSPTAPTFRPKGWCSRSESWKSSPADRLWRSSIESHGVHAGDDHCVADWVEAECQRPFDLVVIPNVDVLVENVGDLGDRHLRRSQHYGERLLGVASALLANLRVSDVAQSRRICPHFENVERRILKGAEQVSFHRRQLQHVVSVPRMPAPDRRVLEDAVFAVSDGLYHGANVVLEPAAIHAGELAERRLVVDPALSRHQLA